MTDQIPYLSPAAIIVGFFVGLAVLGSAFTFIGGFMIKSYLKTSEENEKLKEQAIHTAIKSSSDSLMIVIERNAGGMKAVETKVDSLIELIRRPFNAKPKQEVHCEEGNGSLHDDR